MERDAPLSGVRVIDFSTLLPGPLATLFLSEAGADVVKVEQPSGDGMRSYFSSSDGGDAAFAILNRGKRSVTLDLKKPADHSVALELVQECDILVEQFRPGVMERLGLGYDVVRKINPRVIYCSITGYGQTGPSSNKSGHDINYLGDVGILAQSCGQSGARVLPAVPLADVAGGTYPALLNMLIALRHRDQTGEGTYLDISIAGSLFALSYLPWARHFAGDHAGSKAGPGVMTGGSPRYQLYDASDGAIIAAAPLEEKFWLTFTDAIELESEMRLPDAPAGPVIERVAKLIGSKPGEHWRAVFAERDCCCSVVSTLQEALSHPQFSRESRGGGVVRTPSGKLVPALPIPLAPHFCVTADQEVDAPKLGEVANSEGRD
jgi:alpha-methylacyl-CoA racemase